MKPITFKQARKWNMPAATCRICLSPMTFHASGICTWCDAQTMKLVKIEKPTSKEEAKV